MFELILIQKDNKLNLQQMVSLYKEIWREHYSFIISKKQTEYMLDKFLSYDAIINQIKNRYQYYLIYNNSNLCGSFSIQRRATYLFISKFYLQKSFRGKGLGKKTLDYIINETKKYNLRSIRLNVNRHNPTIKIYETFGFKILKPVIVDIGDGFIMDDYIMELAI